MNPKYYFPIKGEYSEQVANGELAEKSYYENAKVGDTVTINGDITSGTCSIAFK